MSSRRWFEIMLLLSGILLSAQPVAAQSYTNVVWEQLQTAYATADQRGYSTRNYIVGKLNQDESDTWTFEFSPSVDYHIVSVCDGDCRDIDLFVYDENDNEIAADDDVDDNPSVNFTPTKTGARYSIEVVMFECSVDPCYFGIGIFFK